MGKQKGICCMFPSNDLSSLFSCSPGSFYARKHGSSWLLVPSCLSKIMKMRKKFKFCSRSERTLKSGKHCLSDGREGKILLIYMTQACLLKRRVTATLSAVTSAGAITCEVFQHKIPQNL
jgi:hypothetical protein